MDAYGIYTKLEALIGALEEYEKKTDKSSEDIKWVEYSRNKFLRDLIPKSHVLGAAGEVCDKCGGTGRKNSK